jgi:hypothetical protein
MRDKEVSLNPQWPATPREEDILGQPQSCTAPITCSFPELAEVASYDDVAAQVDNAVDFGWQDFVEE